MSMAPAQGQDCPGNPNALGTSRVLAVESGEYGGFGVMQYPETVPLRDKEVVLTFDDGPLPPYSEQVLDILAAQCVKATYFLVGAMAHAFPATVRRMHATGHTIGTHSKDHPSRFQSLPLEKLQHEIDDGIAAVSAALGDPKEVAPFFRVPGLAQSEAIEKELAARSLIVFSSDTVADDWFHRIKASEIVRRAMSRLEARGKGMPVAARHSSGNGRSAAGTAEAAQRARLPYRARGAGPRGGPRRDGRRAADIDRGVGRAPGRSGLAGGRRDRPGDRACRAARARHVIVRCRLQARAPGAHHACRWLSGSRNSGAAGTHWPDGTAVALPSLEVKLPALRKRDFAVWREEKPTASEPTRPRHVQAATHHERERARTVAKPNRYQHKPAIAAAQQMRAPSQKAVAQHARGQSQKSVTPTRKAPTRVDHAYRMERSRRQVDCCS